MCAAQEKATDCHIVKKKKKKEHTSELKEQPRGSHLEKKDSQERELCMKQKIKRREQSIAAFEKDNLCESKEK